MDGCSSGNLDQDCDLEEREVSTTKQGSVSQFWISNKGRGVYCTPLAVSAGHPWSFTFIHWFPKPET